MTDRRGYLHVYTGEGKGKTTAALGLAMRAVGNGMRVLVIQFLKGEGWASGELSAARRLAPQLEIRPRGGDGLVDPQHPAEEDRRMAVAALAEAREEMESGGWDLMVLDEVNVAVHFSLLPLEELLKLVDGRPPRLELVLTGRDAHPALLERAQLVTEMKAVKHYFQQGVRARRGIEE